MLVGVVNWASALIAIPLLVRFGRKKLLIFGQIGMGLCLAALGYISSNEVDIWIQVLTVIFIIFFEFSIGPIMWLYDAEIMTDTGMSAASLLTWMITIVFGLFTNQLFSLLGPSIVYYIFTGVAGFGLFFMIFVIKETKGLSKLKIELLYAPQKYQHLAEDDPYSEEDGS